MKRVLYTKEGKITKFALFTTIAVILALCYFIFGTAIASLQEGMPLRSK